MHGDARIVVVRMPRQLARLRASKRPRCAVRSDLRPASRVSYRAWRAEQVAEAQRAAQQRELLESLLFGCVCGLALGIGFVGMLALLS